MTKHPRTLRYRSVHQLNQSIVRWARSLDPNVDAIVGVPRSGLLAASLLALHMHKPVVDLSSFLAGAEPWGGFRLESGTRLERVLIVDDSVDTGREMRRVREAVDAVAANRGVRVTFGAVYASAYGARFVDSHAEVLPHPRVFEWNILHHPGLLAKACMDIDGVLCADPTARDNDDGSRYRRFLADTELRYRPSTRVRTLVTSRLEKYRPETEAWLAAHDIQYDELIMLDLPSAAERRRLRAHAPHKARAYVESGNSIFIESSSAEGEKIHELTGLPVFVTDTREFLGEGADPDYRDPLRERARAALSRTLGRVRAS